MRKAFTLMLTLVITLVVSAQTGVSPKKGIALKSVPFQKSLAMKPVKTKKAPLFQQVQKTITLNNKNGKKVSVTPTSKIARPTTARVMSKAPRKDEAETVELTCSGSYTFTHYGGTNDYPTGDWYFGAVDDSNSYVIRLDYFRSLEDKYGTFTLADLDTNYSYLADYTSSEGTQYYQYLEGTTFTVSQKNGHDVVEGTLLCDNGVTYNFRAEYVPITIDIEGTDLTTAAYYDSDSDWYLIFENNEYRVTLDLLSPDGTFDGTYTENEALITWCCATNLSTGNVDNFETLTVTLKLAEGQTNPKKGCEITGTAIATNGDTVNFHMLKSSPIVPKEVRDIDVDLTLAEWPAARENCKSYFRFKEKESGANWNFAPNALMGELTEDDFISYLTARIDPVTTDFIEMDHGTVNMTFNKETLLLHISADLVMKDSVEYRFAFDHQIVSQGEVAYDFMNLTIEDSYWDWLGVQWLQASSDDVKFNLTVSDEIPGVYNDNNAYARIYYLNEDGSSTEVDGITIFNAESTLDDNNSPVLHCKFLADDMKIYTVNALFVVPEIQDTLNVNINGMTVNDLIESMNAFQIAGYNDDSSIYVSLAPETTEFAGHYTMDNLATYADYSYFVTINPDGTYVMNDFYQADFDVTKDDKIINITGKFQAGSHWINMTLQGEIAIEGLDYDVDNEDIDINFQTEDLSELVKYENQGYAYVRLQNAERNDCFAMLIYLNTFDDVTMFPEGTYEINDTYAINSVQQGSISSDVSQVYPTFYATCTEDGYLNLPLWLFRSGTVTVVKDADGQLAFEVNAKNSYERTCHITYNLVNTGIKNIDASSEAGVRKMIDNRQVVIKKGNLKFNVVGQEIN